MAAPRFVNVFDSHFGWVSKTLERFGVSEADTPDVTQEVFVVVHAHLASYDATRPLRPWLFGIAYRIASRWRALARHRRELSTEDLGETADERPAVDEELERNEMRALMWRALEDLDPTQRLVLTMNVVHEHSMPDIAQHLGTSVNTGYSRLRLARAALRRAARAEGLGHR